MGDPFNNTNLSVGDTRELILAINDPGASSPSAIENTRSNLANYEHEGSRGKPLERRLYDVDVRLIGSVNAEGDVISDFHFNLDVRQETPVLK